MGSAPSSSSSDSSLEDSVPLPKKYVVQKVLGEGSYGRVVKCLDLDTKQTVAVKTAKGHGSLSNEASILTVLMDRNLDQQSVIKFYDGSPMNKYLVFEVLDISLMEYLCQRKVLMPLQDVRAVVQQLATALDALKNVGVIHADVKTNNIMLVDRVRQPLKVKLIDFGLAIFRSAAKNTKIRQNPQYRAPEVILGLPYSEAVDIWSLGCVMTFMVFGFALFPGKMDYDILRYIIDLMGPPPDRIINAGKKSRWYFKETDSNQWVLKTPEEYWGSKHCSTDNRSYKFRSLDEMKTMRLEKNNMADADERRECIELLKAMFKWDERERITPSEILAHPFITMSYLSSSSHLSSCDEVLESAAAESSPSLTHESSMIQAADSGINQSAEPGIEQTTEASINQAAESAAKQTPQASINQSAEPGIEQTPEASINQAAERGTDQAPESSTSQTDEPGTSTRGTQGSTSGFIRARPAAAGMVTLPSGLIMVQPAPPHNRFLLEETPDEDSILTDSDCTLAAARADALEDTNNPDDTEDGEPERKKKKRKNCIGRFFSWCRRTVFSCYNVVDVAE